MSQEHPTTAAEVHVQLVRCLSEGGANRVLAEVLIRLAIEVEALREALAAAPSPTRDAYREAYARTAALSHNAAGPGGLDKVLRRFFPRSGSEVRFAQEAAMMSRLGASEEEQAALREHLDEVEQYT